MDWSPSARDNPAQRRNSFVRAVHRETFWPVPRIVIHERAKSMQRHRPIPNDFASLQVLQISTAIPADPLHDRSRSHLGKTPDRYGEMPVHCGKRTRATRCDPLRRPDDQSTEVQLQSIRRIASHQASNSHAGSVLPRLFPHSLSRVSGFGASHRCIIQPR